MENWLSLQAKPDEYGKRENENLMYQIPEKQSRVLIDKGLLTQDKGTYKVYDLFFSLWLIKNFWINNKLEGCGLNYPEYKRQK